MTITGLNHLTLAVADLQRSWTFYTDLLGLRPRARWRGGAYLQAGELWLCLSQDDAAAAARRDDYTHVAFAVAAADFAALAQRCVDHGVRQWRSNRSEGESLYLLDPDRHKLEIHVGTLDDRLAAMRQRPYPQQQLF